MCRLIWVVLMLIAVPALGQFYGGCAPQAELGSIPSTWHFGVLVPGVADTLTVEITNIGDAGSVLTGTVQITEQASGAWSIIRGGVFVELRVGDTHLYGLRFAPTEEHCLAADSCVVGVE